MGHPEEKTAFLQSSHLSSAYCLAWKLYTRYCLQKTNSLERVLLNLKRETLGSYASAVFDRHSVVAAARFAGRGADHPPRLLSCSWQTSLHHEDAVGFPHRRASVLDNATMPVFPPASRCHIIYMDGCVYRQRVASGCLSVHLCQHPSSFRYSKSSSPHSARAANPHPVSFSFHMHGSAVEDCRRPLACRHRIRWFCIVTQGDKEAVLRTPWKVTYLVIALFFIGITSAHATVFGELQGIVHDPQHRPIANAQVTIAAAHSGFSQRHTPIAMAFFLCSLCR